jgi:hypothetical protein
MVIVFSLKFSAVTTQGGYPYRIAARGMRRESGKYLVIQLKYIIPLSGMLALNVVATGDDLEFKRLFMSRIEIRPLPPFEFLLPIK